LRGHALSGPGFAHSIDFGEFLMVIKEQKAASAAAGDEGDTILAFVALGGRDDKGGVISADKLRATCKVGSAPHPFVNRSGHGSPLLL
jgi:hypothetical protein